MPSVLSVNVAVERPIASKGGTSGIDKRPTADPVQVRAPGPKGSGGSGIVGDHISDTTNHGGDDQAVYAYAREDLDGWTAELGRDLAPGNFGENLTTLGVDVSGAVIGEIWTLRSPGLTGVDDEVVLQVSCPRIPCGTFAIFLGEKRWVPRFSAARTPGAYLRVLSPGVLRAGAEVEVGSVPAHGMTIATAFAALTTEPHLLPRLAEIDDLPAADLAEIRAAVGRG